MLQVEKLSAEQHRKLNHDGVWVTGIVPNWMNIKLVYEEKMSGPVALDTYMLSLFLIRNNQTHF